MQAINAKKNPNYVHVDEIWKDHVRHEYQAWSNWPDKWGFITREYTRLNKRLTGQRVSPDPEDAHFYANCRSQTPPSASSQITPLVQSDSPTVTSCGRPLKRSSAHNNLPSISSSRPTPRRSKRLSPSSTTSTKTTSTGIEGDSVGRKLPVIVKPQAASSSPRFARTTAALIGWKHDCKLENFGKVPNARGQMGILKKFNWPMQGI
ncbi:uncharacterized protein [Diadema setosum]|uniref:uncharacterized protein n=1 Tax=Diadema setosum TaxID=31175 RepID=UPI003B3A6E4A